MASLDTNALSEIPSILSCLSPSSCPLCLRGESSSDEERQGNRPIDSPRLRQSAPSPFAGDLAEPAKAHLPGAEDRDLLHLEEVFHRRDPEPRDRAGGEPAMDLL